MTLLADRLTYTDTCKTGIFVIIILFYVDFSFLTKFFFLNATSVQKLLDSKKAGNNFPLFKPAHLRTFDKFHKCYRCPNLSQIVLTFTSHSFQVRSLILFSSLFILMQYFSWRVLQRPTTKTLGDSFITSPLLSFFSQLKTPFLVVSMCFARMLRSLLSTGIYTFLPEGTCFQTC